MLKESICSKGSYPIIKDTQFNINIKSYLLVFIFLLTFNFIYILLFIVKLRISFNYVIIKSPFYCSYFIILFTTGYLTNKIIFSPLTNIKIKNKNIQQC